MKEILRLIILLTVFTSLFGCQTKEKSYHNDTIKTKIIRQDQIPDSIENVLSVITNGSEWACLSYSNKDGLLGKYLAYFITTKDSTYGPYDFVEDESFKYTEMGGLLSWIARKNGQEYLYIGKQKYGPFQLIHRVETYKNFVAFQFEVADSSFLQVGNDVFGPFERLDYQRFFLKNGNYVFSAVQDFTNWRGYRKNKEHFIFETLTKKITGPYYSVNIGIMKDSTQFYYGARDTPGLYSGYYNVIRIGNTIYKRFDKILLPSQAGTTIVFAAKKGNEWFLFDGDNKYGPIDSLIDVSISDKTNDYVYSGFVGGKAYIFQKDSMISGPFENVFTLTLSPSGTKYAFLTKEDSQYYVNVGNERSGPYQNLGYITFSPKEDYLDYTTNEIVEKSTDSYLVKITSLSFHHGNQEYGPYRPMDRVFGLYTDNNDFIFLHEESTEGKEPPNVDVFLNGKLNISARGLSKLVVDMNGNLIYVSSYGNQDGLWINKRLIAAYSEISSLDYNKRTNTLELQISENGNITRLVYFNDKVNIGSCYERFRVHIRNNSIVIEELSNAQYPNTQ